jgi:Zn-dependent protease with chaperone function
MASFFRKLKLASDKAGPHFSLPFLSSHPPIEERIRRVEGNVGHE